MMQAPTRGCTLLLQQLAILWLVFGKTSAVSCRVFVYVGYIIQWLRMEVSGSLRCSVIAKKPHPPSLHRLHPMVCSGKEQ